jgi:hypothetical protein
MSDAVIGTAVVETRQAMLRVWMAISAVWVAFWLSIATLIVVTAGTASPLDERLGLFALIVLTPPLAFLAVGALFRCAFEAIAYKARKS